MAGPIVTWVSGHNSLTASANTCAASCRSSSRPSSESRVMISTSDVVVDGARQIVQDRHRPAMQPHLLRDSWPIPAAISAPLVLASKLRTDPSGRVIFGMIDLKMEFCGLLPKRRAIVRNPLTHEYTTTRHSRLPARPRKLCQRRTGDGRTALPGARLAPDGHPSTCARAGLAEPQARRGLRYP